MKRQVIDELDRFVKYLRTNDSNESDLPQEPFQYIDAVQLTQLSLGWSQRNIFAYAFPLDVLRTIFRYLTPKEYFRYAHSLCKRMRQYMLEDVVILSLHIGSERKRYSLYNFFNAHNLSYDGLRFWCPIPGLHYKNWNRINTWIDEQTLVNFPEKSNRIYAGYKRGN
jgi:hypothetical protein